MDDKPMSDLTVKELERLLAAKKGTKSPARAKAPPPPSSEDEEFEEAAEEEAEPEKVRW
jgi:hypothetical protein